MSEHGGLTANVAMLGLLDEAADTIAGVGVRLSERFPGAHWPRPTAHKHLETLVKQGFVRRVSCGKVRSLDRYEITPAGEAYVRDWLRVATVGPPVQRDTALGRIALCRTPQQLSDAIDAIRAEESMYEQAYLDLQSRSIAATRARLRVGGSPGDLRAKLDRIAVVEEAKLWDLTSKRLRNAREELEALLDETRSGPVR